MERYDVGMIHKDLYIKKYDWVVHVFLNAGVTDAEEVIDCVRRVGGSSRVTSRVREMMYDGRYNQGFTYSNRAKNESVMCVCLSSSSKEFINTLAHETRHLCDDIADECMIPVSGETVAYLTGSVMMNLFDEISELVCDCHTCKKNNYKPCCGCLC